MTVPSAGPSATDQLEVDQPAMDPPATDRRGASRPLSGAPKVVFVVGAAMTADLLLAGHLAHLVASGFEVHLICAPSSALERIEKREGVRAHGIEIEREMAPVRDLRSLVRIWKRLRAIAPDLVVASTPKAALLGLLAALLAGVPRRIYTLRGLRLETTTGAKRAILGRAEKTTSKAATRVLAVSRSLEQRYRQLGLLAPGTHLSVPGAGSSNGVDLERFRPLDPLSRENGRSRLGLTPDHFVLGFVGRLTRDKGIPVLLEALDRLPPPCRLLLLGEPEAGDPLDPEVLRRLGHHERIIQVGFQRDTEAYYPLMDVLVFPSLREGFPNAPLEAAACGVPTLGARATGTVDAIDEGMTGHLFEPQSVDALVAGVERYFADAALLAAHGQAARRRAEQLFAREMVWSAWQAGYLQEMLSSP